MIIAITGCIGSGKSYLLSLIHQKYHYEIYSSDEFVQEAYQNPQIMKNLDLKFHCLMDGKINKDIIKSQLNDQTIMELNQILHPYVLKKIQTIKLEKKSVLVFIEVPLLFETNMDKIFDFTIVVSVLDETRHQKLYQRNPQQYFNMLQLEKYQFTNDEKKAKADFIVESEFDDYENLKQIDKIIQQIRK